MHSKRLPRFKRASGIPPIQITERDRMIIRLVYSHRFLRSRQIISLTANGSQGLLRRLQLLFHHGYLERPRVQIEYYQRGGLRHIVYGLGNKGAALLKEESGPGFHESRFGEKNRSVGRIFFEHALLVSDIMVTLELACRKNGNIRLIRAADLSLPGGAPLGHTFKWQVTLKNHLKLGHIPDQIFALEASEKAPPGDRLLCFLEADRGTMPIVRKNLFQTSFFRKLLAYEATWAEGLHRLQFGFSRFRVLTVTTSAARVESLVQACLQLSRGHRLFLFTDQAALQKHGDILTLPWKTGRPGETSTLLD